MGCNEPTKECILRYTGETIDCLGIENNELLETTIQTLADAICAEQETIQGCCNRIVAYSENASIVIGLIPTIMSGTSYTVSENEDGLYSLEYISDLLFGDDGTAEIEIYKNGSLYNATSARTITSIKNYVTPFTLKANNISLVYGDVIDVRATVTDINISANNAIFTLIKLN